MRRLIALLDNPRFEKRQRATDALRALGDFTKVELENVVPARLSLEVRRRIRLLLQEMGESLECCENAHLRAIDLLEYIGTARARKVLRKLAMGEPSALVTRAAQSALRHFRAAQ